MSDAGHNSVSAEQLKSIVDRIQHLDSEAQAVKDDMKEVYAEAKGNGFDVKTIRTIVKLLKKDKAKLQEEREFLELYASAMGYLDLV
jgi:uncharacterized protein (UPF0335 family)